MKMRRVLFSLSMLLFTCLFKVHGGREQTRHQPSQDRRLQLLETKIRLKSQIDQAVKELKKVLSKKEFVGKEREGLLQRIFDTKGDPKKLFLANQIFEKAFKEVKSDARVGRVGDLGAELYKVAVVEAERKSNLTVATNKSSSSRKNHTRPSKFHDTDPDHKKHLSKITHATSKTTLSGKLGLGVDIQIPMKGKSARIVSIKETAANVEKSGSKREDVPDAEAEDDLQGVETRKDYVIELDDEDADDERDVADAPWRRAFDPIMSILHRFGGRGDVDRQLEVLDANEGEDEQFENVGPDPQFRRDRDRDGDSSLFDDGFISPRRRLMGEKLFLSSLTDENENDAEEDQGVMPVDSDPPSMQYLDQEEDTSDYTRSGMRNNPVIYEQVDDDSFFNTQSDYEDSRLNLFSENGHSPVFVDEKKK